MSEQLNINAHPQIQESVLTCEMGAMKPLCIRKIEKKKKLHTTALNVTTDKNAMNGGALVM
jgi:hypothetical protein